MYCNIKSKSSGSHTGAYQDSPWIRICYFLKPDMKWNGSIIM